MSHDNTSLTHSTVDLEAARIHYVTAGPDGADRDPVVLLHGGFQTWRCWRTVIPVLAEHTRVVVPDLRGLGDSAVVDGPYDQRTLAGDIRGLLDRLAIDRAAVVGHDVGAAVATAFAVDHPDRTTRLGFLEYLLCGFGFEEALAPRPDGHHLWFAALNMVPAVPELLVAGHERAYLSLLMREALSATPAAVPEEDLDEYVRCYSRADGWRPLCEIFRATWTNAEQNRSSAAASRLTMPVLAIGGEYSAGQYVGQSIGALADDVRSVVLPGAGHLLAEERPAELLAELLRFLDLPTAVR
ncbi:MAG: alpha/beta fold hydrolase [Dermatophilaceae bacterium]